MNKFEIEEMMELLASRKRDNLIGKLALVSLFIMMVMGLIYLPYLVNVCQ